MRLRFSIRDLLWLTALVAVLVAWWVDRRRLETQAASVPALETKVRQLEYKLGGFENGYIQLVRMIEDFAARPGYEELKREFGKLNETSATGQ